MKEVVVKFFFGQIFIDTFYTFKKCNSGLKKIKDNVKSISALPT